DDVLIIDIRDHSDDPARFGTDADELNHAVCPPHLAIHGILPGVELVGEALADNHHALIAFLVAVVEVAALGDGHAHGLEPARRNGAEIGAEILPIGPMRALRAKRKADAVLAVSAPGHAHAFRYALHTRNGTDALLDVAIELGDLLLRFAIGHYGQIHSQHSGGIEWRTGLLQHEQSLHQHAGAGEQQERCRDLRDGEYAQAPAAATRHAASATGQAALRGMRRGQTRNEREEHRGG